MSIYNLLHPNSYNLQANSINVGTLTTSSLEVESITSNSVAIDSPANQLIFESSIGPFFHNVVLNVDTTVTRTVNLPTASVDTCSLSQVNVHLAQSYQQSGGNTSPVTVAQSSGGKVIMSNRLTSFEIDTFTLYNQLITTSSQILVFPMGKQSVTGSNVMVTVDVTNQHNGQVDIVVTNIDESGSYTTGPPIICYQIY